MELNGAEVDCVEEWLQADLQQRISDGPDSTSAAGDDLLVQDLSSTDDKQTTTHKKHRRHRDRQLEKTYHGGMDPWVAKQYALMVSREEFEACTDTVESKQDEAGHQEYAALSDYHEPSQSGLLEAGANRQEIDEPFVMYKSDTDDQARTYTDDPYSVYKEDTDDTGGIGDQARFQQEDDMLRGAVQGEVEGFGVDDLGIQPLQEDDMLSGAIQGEFEGFGVDDLGTQPLQEGSTSDNDSRFRGDENQASAIQEEGDMIGVDTAYDPGRQRSSAYKGSRWGKRGHSEGDLERDLRWALEQSLSPSDDRTSSSRQHATRSGFREDSWVIRKTKVVLRKGEIATQKTTALVNLVAPSGKIKESTVSHSFCEAGGPDFERMWTNQEFESGTAAQCRHVKVTKTKGCGDLRCHYVLHITLKKVQDQAQMQKYLSRAMQEIFQVCMPGMLIPNGCTYIAMPPLGLGRIYKYPLDLVARCMLTETQTFLQSGKFEPKEVKFVVFGDDAYDAFKTELDSLDGNSAIGQHFRGDHTVPSMGHSHSVPAALGDGQGTHRQQSRHQRETRARGDGDRTNPRQNRDQWDTRARGDGDRTNPPQNRDQWDTRARGDGDRTNPPQNRDQWDTRARGDGDRTNPPQNRDQWDTRAGGDGDRTNPPQNRDQWDTRTRGDRDRTNPPQNRDQWDTRTRGDGDRTNPPQNRDQWDTRTRGDRDRTNPPQNRDQWDTRTRGDRDRPNPPQHHRDQGETIYARVDRDKMNPRKPQEGQPSKDTKEDDRCTIRMKKQAAVSKEAKEKIAKVIERKNIKSEKGNNEYILRGNKQNVQEAETEILKILLDDKDSTKTRVEASDKRRKNRGQIRRGSVDFVKHMLSEDDETPRYWQNYKPGETFRALVTGVKNYVMHSKHCKVDIDVNDPVYGAILKLINETFDSSKIGIGNDATGLVAGSYTKLHVVKVQRIENINLYKKYAAHRKDLFQALCHKGSGHFASLSSLRGNSGDIQTMARTRDVLKKDMYWELNEQLFFHGTKADIVDKICDQGLDSRVGDDKAMFGTGVYGAESATKADQYTDSRTARTYGAGEHKKMLLIRMALGNMFLCTDEKNPEKYKRPPCASCYKSNCKNGKHSDIFDSVVGDNKKLFREFVVYSPDHCYPEYLITYERR